LSTQAVGDCWSGHGRRLPTSSRRSLLPGFPLLNPLAPSFLLFAPKFFHMWSTLPHWLQHMPALPKLLLKTSNIHNFWFIGPKNTIFYSREAYCKTHLHEKFQKSKNSVISSDTNQNRFVRRMDIWSFRN
jgi:hypothetical protein